MLLTRGRVFTSLLLPLTLPGPSERLGRPDVNTGNYNAVEDCLSISIRPTTTAHPSHPSFVLKYTQLALNQRCEWLSNMVVPDSTEYHLYI